MLHQRHSPNDRLVAELEAIEAKAKMPKMWNGTISSLLHSDRTIERFPIRSYQKP